MTFSFLIGLFIMPVASAALLVARRSPHLAEARGFIGGPGVVSVTVGPCQRAPPRRASPHTQVVMAAATQLPDLRALSAVAFLEFLAAPAPAGIVASDLLVLRCDPLLRSHNCRRAAADRARRYRCPAAVEAALEPRGRDRLRAGERLVLVGKRAAVEGLG